MYQKMMRALRYLCDAGDWAGEGRAAFDSIATIIPANSTIGLMVLSYSDSDHLGAVERIWMLTRV